MDICILDSELLCSEGVAATMLPAEGQDTTADSAPQGEDTMEHNDKMEKDTTHTASFRRGRGGGICKPLTHTPGSHCMEPISEDTSRNGLCKNDILVDASNNPAL